jgi:hypothetical protein
MAFDIGENAVALLGFELADGAFENLPILHLSRPLDPFRACAG